MSTWLTWTLGWAAPLLWVSDFLSLGLGAALKVVIVLTGCAMSVSSSAMVRSARTRQTEQLLRALMDTRPPGEGEPPARRLRAVRPARSASPGAS